MVQWLSNMTSNFLNKNSIGDHNYALVYEVKMHCSTVPSGVTIPSFNSKHTKINDRLLACGLQSSECLQCLWLRVLFDTHDCNHQRYQYI